MNNVFRFEVEFFTTPRKKKKAVQGKEIIVFLVGVRAQGCRKFSKVDSGTCTAAPDKFCLLLRIAETCRKSIETCS